MELQVFQGVSKYMGRCSASEQQTLAFSQNAPPGWGSRLPLSLFVRLLWYTAASMKYTSPCRQIFSLIRRQFPQQVPVFMSPILLKVTLGWLAIQNAFVWIKSFVALLFSDYSSSSAPYPQITSTVLRMDALGQWVRNAPPKNYIVLSLLVVKVPNSQDAFTAVIKATRRRATKCSTVWEHLHSELPGIEVSILSPSCVYDKWFFLSTGVRTCRPTTMAQFYHVDLQPASRTF